MSLEVGLPTALCLRDEILGEGGWSIVRKGDVSGCQVAVKTFNNQVLKDVEQSVRQDRFLREVNALKTLGARAPLCPLSPHPTHPTHPMHPAEHFVQLLGYSKFDGLPGPAADGRFYTVLELGGERLDQWLAKGLAMSKPWQPWHLSDFGDIARSLFSALYHLHSRELVHLDVKPENIMRFGRCWKLIDLECCMSIGRDFVLTEDITPLYASPELARAAMATSARTTLVPPSSQMDIWAAGVVLLDVLAEGCCFGEMKASFDLQALFEEEAFSNEGWYGWLSSPEPLDFRSLLESCDSFRGRLDAQLEAFLKVILAKEPTCRLSALQLRDHELLQAPRDRGRRIVEKVFSAAAGQDEDPPLYSRDMLMEVLVCIGVAAQDANCMLDALCQHLGCSAFSCTSLLNFLYHA
ncbi:unnamed protein product [Cladocopium goreaui]|uniref:Non-specific serine/threonine protein kinase n=1 Tax=Cladocopium goreaui TaxID=2562237 RepID=A0A9P1BX02_9DINO|nr:unnamed protein product [Cladocopium goreaui]|mmetsp:Transcript_47238/g.102970  ORF Transcript_47238/g.102970 Transcript_47238/m.102970 type:complete len:409 (+) Transcript_47238:60-1286(+)